MKYFQSSAFHAYGKIAFLSSLVVSWSLENGFESKLF